MSPRGTASPDGLVETAGGADGVAACAGLTTNKPATTASKPRSGPFLRILLSFGMGERPSCPDFFPGHGGVVSMTSLVVAGGLHRTPRASAADLPGWPCPGVRSSPRPKVPAVAGSASTSRRATAPITVAHDAAAEDAEVD